MINVGEDGTVHPRRKLGSEYTVYPLFFLGKNKEKMVDSLFRLTIVSSSSLIIIINSKVVSYGSILNSKSAR